MYIECWMTESQGGWRRWGEIGEGGGRRRGRARKIWKDGIAEILRQKMPSRCISKRQNEMEISLIFYTKTVNGKWSMMIMTFRKLDISLWSSPTTLVSSVFKGAFSEASRNDKVCGGSDRVFFFVSLKKKIAIISGRYSIPPDLRSPTSSEALPLNAADPNVTYSKLTLPKLSTWTTSPSIYFKLFYNYIPCHHCLDFLV